MCGPEGANAAWAGLRPANGGHYFTLDGLSPQYNITIYYMDEIYYVGL